MATAKKRIKWLDVMKCFGIFAIYLGHFGSDGRDSYAFVFTHHVALFFFVSGCAEALSTSDRRILPYIQKRIKTLLIPYFSQTPQRPPSSLGGRCGVLPWLHRQLAS